MPRTALAPAPPTTPHRATADDRRRTSASAILRSVLEHGPVARSTVARLTGLSPASVTDYCARFTALGLIREAPTPRQSNGVGRPHVPIHLDDSRFVVGGVHVAVPYTTVALLDLRGRVVTERRLAHDDGTEPDRVLANAAAGLATLLTDHPGRTPSASASPPAAGWTATPGRSWSTRCSAGVTSTSGTRSARRSGCRSMWTGTRGRWSTGSGCSGGRAAAAACCTCSSATWWTPPSPPTTRCTTVPAPRPGRSPICRCRAARSGATAAGPAAFRPS